MEKALNFLLHDDHLKLWSKWILEESDDHADNFKLQPTQKYQVLKTCFACPGITPEEKAKLKEAVLANDNSDEGKEAEKKCEWVLPDAELKAKLWSQIIDPDTKDSLKDIISKITCFHNRRQHGELLASYYDKYYEILPQVVEKRDREFTEVFMMHLSPAYLARNSDHEAFTKLQEAAGPNAPEFYVNFLKKQIE